MQSLRYYLPTIFSVVLVAFLFQSCLDSTGPQNQNPDEEIYSHGRNPGTSANDFLADSNFTHLVVEVDYMPGYAPQ